MHRESVYQELIKHRMLQLSRSRLIKKIQLPEVLIWGLVVGRKTRIVQIL